MAYGLHISVIFTDSVQADTLEKCLLLQGVQRDIAAGDSLALTGPIGRPTPRPAHKANSVGSGIPTRIWPVRM
jgi:hypothetical protein